MNNLKKVGLTALAGALVSVSANAADLSVTGAASIGFAGEEAQNTGNGWYMNDGITFAASAEMDNGWTVSTSMLLDNSDGTEGEVIDNRSMTIDMGDTGVLTFAADGGSSALDAIDDVTPNAYDEPWALVTGATPAIGGAGGSDIFVYNNSSLMDGLSATISYTPSDNTVEVESSTSYAVAYTGIDGLTIGGGAGEDNGAAASLDITNMYVKYAMDAFTLGYQASESDSETASSDYDMTAIGVSMAVTDDLTVAINSNTIEYEDSTKSDQEALGLSASTVMGSMTFAFAYNTIDNVGGTATSDRSGYDLNLAFAF
jgi:outer membrane protein OmpU